MDFEQCKKQVLELSWRQRLELAQHLLQSLHHQAPPHTQIGEQVQPAPPPSTRETLQIDESISQSFQKLREALESSIES